ncbi:MAG TPA: hypothetical protein VIU11_13080 [Nakamurella sp.]
MTPIAVASLATPAGLFVVLNSRSGDRRLMQAGFRTGALLGDRLRVIGVAVLVVTGASLAVTPTVFDPRGSPTLAQPALGRHVRAAPRAGLAARARRPRGAAVPPGPVHPGSNRTPGLTGPAL